MSSGQPLGTTTTSIWGVFSRHFARRRLPARNSWSPGPWLILPAISTSFRALGGAAAGRSPRASRAAISSRVMDALLFGQGRGGAAQGAPHRGPLHGGIIPSAQGRFHVQRGPRLDERPADLRLVWVQVGVADANLSEDDSGALGAVHFGGQAQVQVQGLALFG